MELLASQPTWMLVVGWLAVCFGCAAGTRGVLQRLLPVDHRAGAATVAGPLMPALGAAFALLAALSLAGEATHLRETEDGVSAEAAAATRLAWSATSSGLDPVPVHAALSNYLQATRANEWKSGEDEGGDAVTRDALGELERAVRASASTPQLGSAQAAELLGSLDGVTAARRDRLAAAHHGLRDFYVAVVALSGLALIANSAALALATERRVALLTAGLVLLVALALALLFAISGPFRGGFRASTFPIDRAITDLQEGEFQP